MGKRLNKKDLRAEIQVELEKLQNQLADLQPRQWTAKEVTAAGWSVKDILGHLIGWHELNMDWYRKGEAGQDVILPAADFTWKQVPELNEKIYKQFRRKSVATVQNAFDESHQNIMKLITDVSPADLTKLNRFSWTGNSWTLSDYIRASTCSHYRWASKHIRRWKRKQI